MRVRAEDRAQGEARLPPLRRQRLGEQLLGADDGVEPEQHEEAKVGAPAEQRGDGAAEHRREHRRQRAHDGDLRRDALALLDGQQVTQDRLAEDDRTGRRGALHDARRVHHLDAGREHARRARGRVGGHGDEQDAAPTVHVAQRPEHQLRRAEGYRVDGDRREDVCGAGVQLFLDGRERRDVDLHGQRWEGRQRTNQEQRGAANAGLALRRLRVGQVDVDDHVVSRGGRISLGSGLRAAHLIRARAAPQQCDARAAKWSRADDEGRLTELALERSVGAATTHTVGQTTAA